MNRASITPQGAHLGAQDVDALEVDGAAGDVEKVDAVWLRVGRTGGGRGGVGDKKWCLMPSYDKSL